MKSAYERKTEKRTSYTIEDIGNEKDLMIWRRERKAFEDAYRMQADRRVENAKRIAAQIVAMEIKASPTKAIEEVETKFRDDNKIDQLNEKRLSLGIEKKKSYMFPEPKEIPLTMRIYNRELEPTKFQQTISILKALIFG